MQLFVLLNLCVMVQLSKIWEISIHYSIVLDITNKMTKCEKKDYLMAEHVYICFFILQCKECKVLPMRRKETLMDELQTIVIYLPGTCFIIPYTYLMLRVCLGAGDIEENTWNRTLQTRCSTHPGLLFGSTPLHTLSKSASTVFRAVEA